MRRSKQNPRNYLFGSAIFAGLLLVALFVSGVLAPQAAARELLTPQQYMQQFSQPQADHLLLDVRTPEEFASGHIAGAVNIPLQELPQRLGEVPQDRTVVLYCRSGNRSAQAASILESAGYSGLYDIAGGVLAWQGSGLPLE